MCNYIGRFFSQNLFWLYEGSIWTHWLKKLLFPACPFWVVCCTWNKSSIGKCCFGCCMVTLVLHWAYQDNHVPTELKQIFSFCVTCLSFRQSSVYSAALDFSCYIRWILCSEDVNSCPSWTSMKQPEWCLAISFFFEINMSSNLAIAYPPAKCVSNWDWSFLFLLSPYLLHVANVNSSLQ